MPRRVGIELVVTGAQAARATLDAFARDAKVLNAQQYAIGQGVTQRLSNQFAGIDPNQIRTSSQRIVQFGNTLKSIDTITLAGKNGLAAFSTEVVNYTGDVERLLPALRNLNDVQLQARNINAAAGVEIREVAAAYEQQAVALQKLKSAQATQAGYGRQAVADITARRQSARFTDENGRLRSFGRFATQEQADAAYAETVKETAKDRRTASKAIKLAEQEEQKATQELAAVKEAYARDIQGIRARARSQIGTSIVNARGEVISAYNATPPLPRVLNQLSNLSPSLLSKLQGAGLGGGAAFGSEQFTNNLINQGAYDSIRITKDLVKQTTRVSGSFLDSQKILNNFTAEIDKNGKVLTRFGGQLSGLSGALTQIGRDFQKVGEFVIATTVIFGGLAYAVNELRTVTELDKNLRQLSITANLTKEQTDGLFEGLAQVSVETATPLQEIVKAADDIALATRRAGQSTQEWQENIISLSKSVGILTNLAGIDTVKATDLLVSSMKQLNLQADQLPGILNKVTAVAGGQSAAIADIVQGLGVMAEAGKQGGLSVDQLIATVQTLSQVTSKTPAEVATSFKNLVGSLGGPAALKALANYNIAVKDTEGNLRNIIDVYSEISDKIESGIIPRGDVQALVRAISGGPRRAPDAAALLSNIGTVQDVTQTSINATNEALLANAKILDTVQAKFVQLQSRIDKFAQTKFSNALSEGLDNISDILTGVLNILQSLPTGLYVLIFRLGVLAVTTKLTIGLFKILAGGFFAARAEVKALATDLLGLNNAQLRVAETARLAATTTASGLILPAGVKAGTAATAAKVGRLANLRNTIGANRSDILTGLILPGALAGGLESGLAGGNPLTSIGVGLQGAGISGLLAPLPIPHFKAFAAAVTAVGFALQFLGEQQKKGQEKTEVNAEAVLNATQAYREAAKQVEDVTRSQNDITKSLDVLQNKTKPDKADQQAILGYQKDYAENVAKLIGLNSQLADSFTNLSDALKGATGNLGIITAQAISAGVFTKDQLKEITGELAPEILKATNPNFAAPNDFTIPQGTLNQYAATAGSTQATYNVREFQPARNAEPGFGHEVIKQATLDLESLRDTQSDVLKLFNESGTAINTAFAPTYDNLQLIDTALKAIKDDIDPQKYKQLQSTFQEYAASVNALFGAEKNAAVYSAYLEAGGATQLFTQDEIDRGNALLKVYVELAKVGATRPTAPTDTEPRNSRASVVGRSTQSEVLNQANALFETIKKGGELSKDSALAIFKELIPPEALANLEKNNTLVQAAGAYYRELGLTVKGVTDDVRVLADEGIAANAELVEALGKLNGDIVSDAASKLATLQAQFQGGEFKGQESVYKKQVDQLKQIIVTADEVIAAYTKAADTIPNLNEQMSALSSEFVKVNGLQDAASLTTDQLIGRLFQLADTYGLTGDQVIQLGEKMINLIGIIERISQIRAEFGIGAHVDLKAAIAQLKAFKAAIFAAAATAAANGFYPSTLSVGTSKLDQAIKDLENAQGITSGITNILSKGQGTKFGSRSSGTGGGRTGGTSTRGSGLDVSELDLPEEIANAANRDALIKLAIKNARELQSKIPGATAEGKNDVVELLKGTQRILEVRGVKDDLLRKALEELADIEKKRLEFETKADTIRRIRVGAGDFSAIANVPVNTRTGVSLGGPEGPINISLNLNGTVLTPAQLTQFADLVAAALKRQIANG